MESIGKLIRHVEIGVNIPILDFKLNETNIKIAVCPKLKSTSKESKLDQRLFLCPHLCKINIASSSMIE